jgi:hypothetical protein
MDVKGRAAAKEPNQGDYFLAAGKTEPPLRHETVSTTAINPSATAYACP